MPWETLDISKRSENCGHAENGLFENVYGWAQCVWSASGEEFLFSSPTGAKHIMGSVLIEILVPLYERTVTEL